MTTGHGPMQPGWDNLNRGRYTVRPDNPLDGCRGLRAQTACSLAGRGKGMGATPALCGVARPKSTVEVEVEVEV
jgi:hypothetical protein